MWTNERAFTDRAPFADHAALADRRALLDQRPIRNRTIVQLRIRPDIDIFPQDGSANGGTAFNDRTVADARWAFDRRPRSHGDAVSETNGANDGRTGVDPAVSTRPHAGRNLGSGTRGCNRPGKRVVVCLLVLLQISDVGPIIRDHVPAEALAFAQHARKEILREVVVLPGFHVVEDLRLQHIDSGVDGIRKDFSPRRFFHETRDAAVVVGYHDAELERIAHTPQRDRRIVLRRAVRGNQRREIDVGHSIPGDDHERVVAQAVLRHFHRTGRAERRVFDDVVHLNAERAPIAEITFDFIGKVVQRRYDVYDAVRAQEFDDVMHDGPIGDRRERLGTPRSQRPQARPLATRHNYSTHRTYLASFDGRSSRIAPASVVQR